MDVFGVLPALLAFDIERFYPLKVVGWTLLSILAIWAATPFTLGTCQVMIFSLVSFGLREHVLRCGNRQLQGLSLRPSFSTVGLR